MSQMGTATGRVRNLFKHFTTASFTTEYCDIDLTDETPDAERVDPQMAAIRGDVSLASKISKKKPRQPTSSRFLRYLQKRIVFAVMVSQSGQCPCCELINRIGACAFSRLLPLPLHLLLAT